MDDTNRNITEVIMQIHNVFRYADPVIRLTTIGTIKLIQVAVYQPDREKFGS